MRRDVRLTRRSFLGGVAGLVLVQANCRSLPVGGLLKVGPPPRVGVLYVGLEPTPRTEALLDELRILGWIDGQSAEIHWRWSGPDPQRLARDAADLVQLPVDVLITAGTLGASSARAATSTTPVVFVAASDPVGTGLVSSLARPGGNLTGLTLQSTRLRGKSHELFKGLIPALTRLAVIFDPANPSSDPALQEDQASADALRIDLRALPVQNASELDTAFETASRWGADGVSLAPSALLQNTLSKRAADTALQYRLPLFAGREVAEAGGLAGYGPNQVALYRRAAHFTDRILRGTSPAELPVEQPVVFEFVVNLSTAEALGLTIAPDMQVQVTDWV